ncbi:heparan-alpha-glucosaminide N-acetyltransferase domain-containing protein [Nocardiopsis potens]|uniref:heparan-alpha-glucosaminide N-acetyltransferase domain-containing protein n=1 Tax=Nocardiopsis potens TaxID=1246458 RepID=UPI00034DBD46|nr:heparan-alpha-glucosaminide N-acetyltransferase domain-containing protein [Nocardiopsis potens]
MTQTRPSPSAPPSLRRARAAEPAGPDPRPSSADPERPPAARDRLRGLDLARWIAVAGMLVIHFGPPFLDRESPLGVIVATYAWGRSTILFAFLAGVSLALVTGGAAVHRGRRARTGAARVAVRGAALVLIGWGLHAVVTAGGSNLTVIITYYGLYFLLAIPLLRLSAPWAAAAAAAAFAIGPQLLFALRRSAEEGGAMAGLTRAVEAHDPGHLVAGQGLMELAVHGYYPALAYLPAVLAGLAVGRLDLHSPLVRARLAAFGALVAFLSYRTSWHAWYNYGLIGELGAREENIGSVPTGDARWLLTDMPHSATTPEVLGGTGVAMAVLACCLGLADRLPRLTAPFTAAGSMALTVYAVHAVVMAWQAALPEDPGGLIGAVNREMSEIYLVGSVAVALLWRRTLGRGPLEAGVSELAKAVAPGPRSPAHARRRARRRLLRR